jgi:hypothetical protein
MLTQCGHGIAPLGYLDRAKDTMLRFQKQLSLETWLEHWPLNSPANTKPGLHEK